MRYREILEADVVQFPLDKKTHRDEVVSQYREPTTGRNASVVPLPTAAKEPPKNLVHFPITLEQNELILLRAFTEEPFDPNALQFRKKVEKGWIMAARHGMEEKHLDWTNSMEFANKVIFGEIKNPFMEYMDWHQTSEIWSEAFPDDLPLNAWLTVKGKNRSTISISTRYKNQEIEKRNIQPGQVWSFGSGTTIHGKILEILPNGNLQVEFSNNEIEELDDPTILRKRIN